MRLMAPMNDHLAEYNLTEIQQRGAKSECSGTMDNLLTDRMVLQGSILQKFYTCNLQVQLLFSARETIATLVKYKCKTFITLTPGLCERKKKHQYGLDRREESLRFSRS